MKPVRPRHGALFMGVLMAQAVIASALGVVGTDINSKDFRARGVAEAPFKFGEAALSGFSTQTQETVGA